MADNATRSSEVADLTRRDVLRVGAGAGVLGIAAIAQTSAFESGDAFVVKPYLQPGDAPRLRKSEQNASVNQLSDVRIDSRRLTLRQIDLNGNLIDQIVITK